MIRIIHSVEELLFFELMHVYEEGNIRNAIKLYPDMDKNAALIQVEQDYFQYISDVFFTTVGSFYAIWVVSGHYTCALRMEPFEDGLLMEGLETAPEYRRQGYATNLILETLKRVTVPVYSHVMKDNEASLRVHHKCGFVRVLDHAKLIDGKMNRGMVTLRYCK